MQLYSSSWQDNWLFCQKRIVGNGNNTNLIHEPVAMFVPVPESFELARATIGDRDIDELSELSELYAYETSTEEEEESEDEKFVSLERDLEHTEYAVLPLRRLSKRETVMEEEMIVFKDVPKSLKVEAGKIAKIKCCVSGSKPLGKWIAVFLLDF